MENREIRFRAWDESLEQMIFVGDERRWGGITNDYIFRNYFPSHIMQFTGLYDKNDKPIYEGDIIEFEYWNKPFDRVRSEVKYDNYEAYYVSAKGGTMGVVHVMNIEIIGNIYENKELLEN